MYVRRPAASISRLGTTLRFFVGEIGAGKPTLLEAIAQCCDFNLKNVSRDHYRCLNSP